MQQFNNPKVLIVPLDWGLGHTTRCIPIIKALQKKGFQIFVGANKTQAILLSNELADVHFLPKKGYNIHYAKSGFMLPLALLVQIPKILVHIISEHLWLKKQQQKWGFHYVISDNRYGLFHKGINCIFITHQLTIQAPSTWLEKSIQWLNYQFIKQFTACWIPDVVEENGLGGRLSHPQKLPLTQLYYIGLLSRWAKNYVQEQEPSGFLYDGCWLISGPEPQRSLLEHKAHEICNELPGNWLIIAGKPTEKTVNSANKNSKITCLPHANGNTLYHLLLKSKVVICRSGYTSLMELVALNKKAILIPTPGQTEQQYLAEKLSAEKQFASINQNELTAKKIAAILQEIHLFHPKNYRIFTDIPSVPF